MKTQRGLILVIAMMLWIVALAAVALANNPGAAAPAANLPAAGPELALPVAQKDKKIKLTIVVRDVDRNPVDRATINVWHDTWGLNFVIMITQRRPMRRE